MLRSLIPLFLFFQAAALCAQGNAASDSLVTEGVRLHDEGKYEEALARFGQAVKLDEKNGNALYETGNTYFAIADYKQALKYADKTIKNKYNVTAQESIATSFKEAKPVYDMMVNALGPMGLTLDYAYVEKTRPEIVALLK